MMTDTTQQLTLGGQKIVEDLRVLLRDSEEMLRLAANVPSEGVGALCEKLGTHVETLQSAFGDTQQSAQRRYRAATVNTERYVRRNPWRTIGIAAGVGFVLGVLTVR
ncbi:MAG: ElaB protein [uncultured Paraburkholderia sp.]|nr:MAG: ElaB protein [uncultured Paraburkholderia sp.]CAH2914881.1 MAG: ElaB protein [uncultured Paraburkholderia sp.]